MKDTLAPLFDFCVSGEDVDVFPHRKPSAEIYHAALSQWKRGGAETEELSHVWFHVGDCLANDVGASSDVGAHAIWIVKEEPAEQPTYSTASKEEIDLRGELMEAARGKMSGQIKSMKELNAVMQNIMGTSNWQEKVPGVQPESFAELGLPLRNLTAAA